MVTKNLVPISLMYSLYKTFGYFIATKFRLSVDRVLVYGHQIYTKFWVRYPAYVCGMLAAWFLLHYCKGKLVMKSSYQTVLWNLCACIFLLGIYSTIFTDRSVIEDTIFLNVHRIYLWLICCWMFMAAGGGLKTRWSHILEHKIFRHFSRVCFAMYILNPLLIMLLVHLSVEPKKVDFLQIVSKILLW